MNYDNPENLRHALLEQIKTEARADSDLERRLIYEVAYERLLARLDPEFGFVVGGIATKYLLPSSPATKDVDLFIQQQIAKTHHLLEKSPEERSSILQKLVERQLKYENKPDHFRFIVSAHVIYFTDQAQNQMAAQLEIQVSIAGVKFAEFPLKIGIPDRKLPQQRVLGKDKLGFAGVKNPEIATLCPEYVLADKAIIYQKNMLEPGFDRVRDLVHMVLLMQNAKLNEKTLTQGLAHYAVRKGIVGTIQNTLIPMRSKKWEERFVKVSGECGLTLDSIEAVELINSKLDPLRSKAAGIARSTKSRSDKESSRLADETSKFLIDAAQPRIQSLPAEGDN